MKTSKAVQPSANIESAILTVRGERVLLDMDLARIYGVPTKRLNEQVKRNRARFPKDFAFQLTPAEKDEVVANCDHLHTLKFSPVRPYAFTEQGALMAANVLNSPQAVRNLRSEICHLQSSEAWPPPEPEPPRRQIGFHARPTDDAGTTKDRKR